MPLKVKCFASSTTSIDVEWEAAVLQGEGGLLTEYRVTAFALDEQVVASVNSTAETRVRFTLHAANEKQRMKPNLVYSVQVEALYDKAAVKSKAAVCLVPQSGLPCIPPVVADDPANGAVQQRGSTGNGASYCPCLESSRVYDALKASGYINAAGVVSVSGTPKPFFRSDRNGTTYGSDRCASHDIRTPPDCADDEGEPLVGAPDWCASVWCYVDPAVCHESITTTLSTYFQGSKLHYSYASCGETVTYTAVKRAAVCGCKPEEFHTSGMPGTPPREWECKTCVEGAKCNGGAAISMRTKPGWYVSGNTTLYATRAQPQLYRCPGGRDVCPGNVPIATFLRTPVAGVSPCDAGGNVRAEPLDVPALDAKMIHNASGLGVECQCSAGGIGMQCDTCMDGWAKMGITCKRCPSKEATTGRVLAISFGIVAAAAFASLVALYFSRPPRVERLFCDAFKSLDDVGVRSLVKSFFGDSAMGEGGVTKEIFLAKCAEKLPLHLSPRPRKKARDEARRAVERVWVKLDANHDGAVSLDEFTTFLYHLREGSRSTSRVRSIITGALAWWSSTKLQTLRSVLISHLQIVGSIAASFPDLIFTNDDERIIVQDGIGNEVLDLSGVARPHDSTLCVEYGYPTANAWQLDPKCCSIHANAGCAHAGNTAGGSGNLAFPAAAPPFTSTRMRRGAVCGSGPWGEAHITICTPDEDVPASMVRAVKDLASVVGNINLSFLKDFNCFVGPRHVSILVWITGTTIVVLIALGLIPVVIGGTSKLSFLSHKLRSRAQRIRNRAVKITTQAALTLVFLVRNRVHSSRGGRGGERERE